MSDAWIFTLVFTALFVVRAIIATVVFFWILPDDGRCPNCDCPTLRVQSSRAVRWMYWLRSSWCYECGWHGFLRLSDPSPSRTSAAIRASFRSIRRSHRSI